jgi:hypothetical protein
MAMGTFEMNARPSGKRFKAKELPQHHEKASYGAIATVRTKRKKAI